MAANPLDPYVAKATDHPKISPQEKIKGVHEIIKAVKSAMLTTRAADGHMHSRAMAPAGPHEDSQLTLYFIGNNVSDKFDEIANDQHVNVSFSDHSTTNWVSYCGIARVSQDRDLIKKHWSKLTAAWFGDLKDGVHKGDENDPRVSIIEVVPDEIRYWITKSGTISQGAQVAFGAVTGHAAAPGELRTISKDEIQLTQGLNTN
ncbi:hypothetical protein FIBSPDRAFT_739199 [Athelia psychrophila]|uniref:General stress protein FMN-binding split barrel domain-containing protein n=1 Tax=Athelia psychrophila TaxID=1759441 RepID=A0A166KZ62_9AGAM|nr:hypothetical protein FIBSPDRAFT_739199 [Fibularhizoctonia sp. CBS 109695]